MFSTKKIFFLLFIILFSIEKTSAQPRIHYGFLSGLYKKQQWIVGGKMFCKIKIDTTVNYIALQNQQKSERNLANNFNLIFEENFDADTIDTQKWCISAHNDDRPCDGFSAENPLGDVNKTGLNTKNVTVKNGVCSISVTHESNGFCNYSGGELKTFSSLPNHTFKDYEFQPNAYIEMRVQIPFGAGIGSSAWLYSVSGGHYNEIDIWETLGNKPTKLMATYIEEKYDGKTNTKRNNGIEPVEIDFYNKKNKPQNLENQWLTLGLEWSDTSVTWSVNRVPVRYLSLKKVPPCFAELALQDIINKTNTAENPKAKCRYAPYRNTLPFTFRIGTAYGCLGDCGQGKNALQYAKLPAKLLIDYVKVYQKKTYKSCKIEVQDIVKKIKKSDFVTYEKFYAKCSHFPDAKYEWSSDDFVLTNTESANAIGLMPKQNLDTNQVCSVTCTVIFPSGYREKNVKSIKIVE